MAECRVLRGQIGPASSRNHPCVGQMRETNLGFLAFSLLLGILGLETSTFICSSRNNHCGSYLRQPLQDSSTLFSLPSPRVILSVYVCVYTQWIYFALPFECKLQTSLDFSMPLLRIKFTFHINCNNIISKKIKKMVIW